MLITTQKNVLEKSARVDGDKLIVVHASEVSGLLKANQELRKSHNNGFTDERSMRLIGVVDNVAYLAIIKKYPEIEQGSPKDKKKAWRKVFADPEFAGYKTVEGGI